MYWIGLVDPIHLLVEVRGVVVAVNVNVVVDGPVAPLAKIINKIPTAHVVCSPIYDFTLTLIPHLSVPCFLFYLAHPPLPYSSTVNRLPVPKIKKKKNPTAHLHRSPHCRPVGSAKPHQQQVFSSCRCWVAANWYSCASRVFLLSYVVIILVYKG